MRAVLLAPIRFYQRFISPALPPRCRYYPTCSDYAVQAIRRFGILRGAVLAAWRSSALMRSQERSRAGSDTG